MDTTAAGPDGVYQRGKEYSLNEKKKKFVPNYAHFT